MDLGDRLPDLELRTAEGEVVVMPRAFQRVTVVQLLRYYG
jgi:hypothetical protein